MNYGIAKGTSAAALFEPNWFALRTRSKSEKRVDGWLRDRGIEVNAALAPIRRQWSDRMKTVVEPLFPGYVFVRIAPVDFSQALMNPWSVAFVRGSHGPLPLRPEEVEAIDRLVNGIAETGTLPQQVDYLMVGDRVRVIEGPFKGMEGLMVAEQGSCRVVVQVDALRLARSLNLPRSILKRLPAAPADQG